MNILPQLVPLSKTPVVFVPTLTPYEAGQLDAQERIPAMQFRLYICVEDEIAYMMGFDDALAETDSKPGLSVQDSAGLMDYDEDAIENDYEFIRTGGA